MTDFETHPIGTGKRLRELENQNAALRAESAALISVLNEIRNRRGKSRASEQLEKEMTDLQHQERI